MIKSLVRIEDQNLKEDKNQNKFKQYFNQTLILRVWAWFKVNKKHKMTF